MIVVIVAKGGKRSQLVFQEGREHKVESKISLCLVTLHSWTHLLWILARDCVPANTLVHPRTVTMLTLVFHRTVLFYETTHTVTKLLYHIAAPSWKLWSYRLLYHNSVPWYIRSRLSDVITIAGDGRREGGVYLGGREDVWYNLWTVTFMRVILSSRCCRQYHWSHHTTTISWEQRLWKCACVPYVWTIKRNHISLIKQA